MKNKTKIIALTAIISISLGLGLTTNAENNKKIQTPAPVQKVLTQKAPSASYEEVSSIAIVANPTKYLNKHVKIKAKFDKFSTLGLDYKPAFRSSEKFITFLIKRDDVKDHTIPLAELKNFLNRDTAEKYIDLKSGDEIEYTGVVFSDALGDAWLNVDSFKVLNKQDKTPAKK